MFVSHHNFHASFKESFLKRQSIETEDEDEDEDEELTNEQIAMQAAIRKVIF